METERKPLPVGLTREEREMVEKLAKQWGCSHAAVIRRLIREALEKQQ